jgi:hypothetical protein
MARYRGLTLSTGYAAGLIPIIPPQTHRTVINPLLTLVTDTITAVKTRD